jgi:hypothetical protein
MQLFCGKCIARARRGPDGSHGWCLPAGLVAPSFFPLMVVESFHIPIQSGLESDNSCAVSSKPELKETLKLFIFRILELTYSYRKLSTGSS